MKRLSLCGLLLGAATAHCWAGSVLVWEDYDLGTSAVTGAITLAGDTETLAPDQATFNTLLAGGGWTAVIFAEQGGFVYADSASQLSTWIAGGGDLIADTWQDGGLDNLLDASSASTNGTTITTTGDPIFAGLGSTITLSNPGWSIFSQGYNALAGGTCLGTIDSGGCAVVLGNGGQTYLNGPLTDTYSSISDGQTLMANELEQFAATATPEPATLLLGGSGVGLLLLVGALRRKLHR